MQFEANIKKRRESIGLFASRALRDGANSPFIRFIREIEPYWRESLRPEIFAIEETYAALRKYNVLDGYKGLHCLPSSRSGGVVALTDMVVSDSHDGAGVDSVVYLIDPRDPMSLLPDSAALKRECIVNGKPFLATYAAAMEWYKAQWCATSLPGAADSLRGFASRFFLASSLLNDLLPECRHGLERQTIALIAHDATKLQMLEFAERHFELLKRFSIRIATGTTGELLNGRLPARLADAWEELEDEHSLFQKIGRAPSRINRRLKEREAIQAGLDCMRTKLKGETWVKVTRSGPRGGDIRIGELVRKGECQKILFFEDPFTVREHEADIQVLERTTRLYQQNVMCLHDHRSAAAWANNLERCAAKGIEDPMTIFEAFRLIWGVDLVLSRVHNDAHAAGAWRGIVDAGARYIHGLIAGHTETPRVAGQPFRIALNESPATLELLSALDELADRRAIHEMTHTWPLRDVANARLIANNCLLALPASVDEMPIGLSGQRESGVAWLPQLFGGQARMSYSSEQDGGYWGDETTGFPRSLASHWDHIDLSIVMCGQSNADCWPLVDGGPENGSAKPNGYAGGKMSCRQFRSAAKKGGSVLIAGAENQQETPVLAALRSGMVSVLVTSLDFAQALLRMQAAEMFHSSEKAQASGAGERTQVPNDESFPASREISSAQRLVFEPAVSA